MRNPNILATAVGQYWPVGSTPPASTHVSIANTREAGLFIWEPISVASGSSSGVVIGVTAAQMSQIDANALAIAGINTQVSDIDLRVGTVEAGQASDVESNVTLDYAANGEDMPTDGSQHAKVLALDPNDYTYPAIVKIQYEDGATCHRVEGDPLAWVEFRRDENLHSLIATNAQSVTNLSTQHSALESALERFKNAEDRTGSVYTLDLADRGFAVRVDNDVIIPSMAAGTAGDMYQLANSSASIITVSALPGSAVAIRGVRDIAPNGFFTIIIESADGITTYALIGGEEA